MTNLTETMINKIVKEIETMIKGTGKSVKLQKIKKNNDVELTGINILFSPDEKISPTLYVEHFITEEDFNPKKAAKTIIAAVEEEKDKMPMFNLDFVKSFEEVKDKLSISLINYATNEKLLQDIPYEKFLDLAIICIIKVNNIGIIKVNYHLLQNWNIDKKELFRIAKEKSLENSPPVIQNMSDIINEPSCSESNQMYVLTNHQKYFGASVILYKGLLKDLADEMNSDLVIIPSSIHDVILLPYTEDIDNLNIPSMICDINKTQLDATEVLSNHPYFYMRDMKRITM